jgi:pyrophosphatase PpaX
MTRPIALLFDLDGTLIDTVELLLDCVRHAFTDHPGRRPTQEEWIAGIGTPLASQMDPYVSSRQERDSLIDRYRTFQREHHDRLTRSYDGVEETIRELRDLGHPMGIVTSKGNELMNRSLEYVGLAPFMDVAIGCDSCPVHKPDPFPVRMALQELGYEPHEAAFIGDSPHDMAAGRGAGVTTVAALWGPFTREKLVPSAPDHFLERITDLPALVRRISGGPGV